MSGLTASLISRGGRSLVKRECATDPEYGHANRNVIQKITSEMREKANYDARFDYRDEAQQDLEPWQMRRKFT